MNTILDVQIFFEQPTSCSLLKKVSDDKVFTLKLIRLKYLLFLIAIVL